MRPVDVVFLLDSSSSEGRTNFHKLLTFVQTFVQKFSIGPSDMQVSVVTFSTTVVENFNLKASTSKAAVLRAIDQIQYLSRTPDIGNAIRFVYQHSFSSSSGDRFDAPNVMILITDGHSISRSPSSTLQAAGLAHQAGIHSFVIGVGGRVLGLELRGIASDPQYVFQTSTFDELSRLQTTLSTTTCEGIYLVYSKHTFSLHM